MTDTTVECQEWIAVSLRVPDKLKGHLDRDAIHNSLVRQAERALKRKYGRRGYRAYHQQVTTHEEEGGTRYVLRSYVQRFNAWGS